MKYLRVILFAGLIGILLNAAYIAALPTGPTTINIIGSSSYSINAPSNVSAIAGNVTQIDFGSNAVSQTWQGYYGNVSGTILLGNSQNQTIYNWNSISPTGQIYATRSSGTPVWTSIRCANLSEISSEDTYLSVNESTDPDSVNSTFLNTTAFTGFYVGSALINSSQDCYATHLYNSSGVASSNFQEVLLSDTSSFIYTGILTKDSIGFDNSTHDYEMLVGDNGHAGNTASTPYYFYLELG